MNGKTLRKIHFAEPILLTLSSVLPEKIKFFSEAEINSEIGNSVYDNSLKGTPASKIMRGNQKGVNITLNLLCGLEGVL